MFRKPDILQKEIDRFWRYVFIRETFIPKEEKLMKRVYMKLIVAASLLLFAAGCATTPGALSQEDQAKLDAALQAADAAAASAQQADASAKSAAGSADRAEAAAKRAEAAAKNAAMSADKAETAAASAQNSAAKAAKAFEMGLKK